MNSPRRHYFNIPNCSEITEMDDMKLVLFQIELIND